MCLYAGKFTADSGRCPCPWELQIQQQLCAGHALAEQGWMQGQGGDGAAASQSLLGWGGPGSRAWSTAAPQCWGWGLAQQQSCFSAAQRGKTTTSNLAFHTRESEAFLLLFCVFSVLAWNVVVYFCRGFFAFRKVNLLEREKQMMMTKQVRSLRNTWSVMKRKKMMINIEEAQQLVFVVVVFSIYMFIYIVQFC